MAKTNFKVTVSSVHAIEGEITDGMRNNPEIFAEFYEFLEEVKLYAILISPLDTGEYIAHMKIRKLPPVRGLPRGQVYNDDWKAHLIEYGTVDTPEFAVMRRTYARYIGGRD